MARLKVTQTKSYIGSKQNHRDTLRSLGLKRLNDTVVKEDRPEIRGMVHTVRHLVTVDEQCEWPGGRLRRAALASQPLGSSAKTGPAALPQPAAGPFFRQSFSVSSGTILNRSPTRPMSATWKIGASSSLLMATIVLESFIPARCWIAPEIPIAI